MARALLLMRWLGLDLTIVHFDMFARLARQVMRTGVGGVGVPCGAMGRRGVVGRGGVVEGAGGWVYASRGVTTGATPTGANQSVFTAGVQAAFRTLRDGERWIRPPSGPSWPPL